MKGHVILHDSFAKSPVKPTQSSYCATVRSVVSKISHLGIFYNGNFFSLTVLYRVHRGATSWRADVPDLDGERVVFVNASAV